MSQQQLESENTVSVPLIIAKKDTSITSRYYDNLLKTKELQQDGLSKRIIAKMLKMSRNTINKYWNRTSFLPKVNHKKSNILDFEDYLIKRWQQGEQNVKKLFEEIKEQGVKNDIKIVYELVRQYPRTNVEPIPNAVKIKYYSSQQLSIWLSAFKDWSDEWPQAYLEKLLKDNPIINKARKVVLDFRRLMKEINWQHGVMKSSMMMMKMLKDSLKGFLMIFKLFIKVLFQIGAEEPILPPHIYLLSKPLRKRINAQLNKDDKLH